MNNLMICANANKNLHLNESVGEKYILEGVFAELDVLNRNQRIYKKDEYLKHLQYLRNDIKNGETLFGELDHPEDRFEVKLKEASHRVIDLWYDEGKNVIMGKIELLNTPNGNIAKSLVEQNIPLRISSRAMGKVNSDNTVSIQQIYTYDLVCKPGFAGAVLHRVNESAQTYSDDVRLCLEGFAKTESLNKAASYGILCESVTVSDMEVTGKLRKEAKAILESTETIDADKLAKDMSKRLFEDDEADKNDGKDNADNTDNANDTNDGGDNGENDSNSDEDPGVKIYEVRGIFEDDGEGVEIAAVSKKEGDEEEKKDDNTEDESKTVECDGDNCDGNECKDGKCSDGKKTGDMINDSKEELDKLKERSEKKDKQIDDMIAAIKNKSECRKSKKANEAMILSQYPIARCMTEANFTKFESLNESQKKKVVDYLNVNGMKTVGAINENWEKGLDFVAEEPVWLRYAPESYKKLYESADETTRHNIYTSAEYVVFESQYDVNIFWENTGLGNKTQSQLLNESFVQNLPAIEQPKAASTELPYTQAMIDAVKAMACSYND